MDLVNIDSLGEHVGQEVWLAGWVAQSRSSGKIAFLVVRDGTGRCQCVIERNERTESFFTQARHLPQESSIRIGGEVREEPRAPGGYELHASGLEVIHASDDYPITPKPHGTDYLFRHRHLWLRSSRPHALLRVRHTLVDAIREFFNDRGFTLIDTPIFTPSAGEGAQTLFEVDYFGEPVYLAQTGQLYLEAACMSHGKVYCFGPTFRAEKSKTRRHLTEFWMVEPEVAFADLDDIMQLAEDFVLAIVGRVLADNRADLEQLGRDVAPLERIRAPFVRLSYSEAVELLHGPKTKALLDDDLATRTARRDELSAQIDQWEGEKKAAKKAWQQEKLAQQVQAAREEIADLDEHIANIPHHLELARGFEWGKDLGGSDETIISRLFDRPVFVHRYPRGVKAFYMRTDREDSRVVLNFDLLAPEGVGEIIGGSAREEDLDRLAARMAEEGLETGPYEWYLDLRRFGSVPHGGFGLGVERTLAWLCGIHHIRETIPFPRLMGKIYP